MYAPAARDRPALDVWGPGARVPVGATPAALLPVRHKNQGGDTQTCTQSRPPRGVCGHVWNRIRNASWSAYVVTCSNPQRCCAPAVALHVQSKKSFTNFRPVGLALRTAACRLRSTASCRRSVSSSGTLTRDDFEPVENASGFNRIKTTGSSPAQLQSSSSRLRSHEYVLPLCCASSTCKGGCRGVGTGGGGGGGEAGGGSGCSGPRAAIPARGGSGGGGGRGGDRGCGVAVTSRMIHRSGNIQRKSGLFHPYRSGSSPGATTLSYDEYGGRPPSAMRASRNTLTAFSCRLRGSSPLWKRRQVLHSVFLSFVVVSLHDTHRWLPPCTLQNLRGLAHGQTSPVVLIYSHSLPDAFDPRRQVIQLFTRLPCSHSIAPVPHFVQRLLWCPLPQEQSKYPPCSWQSPLCLPQPHTPLCLLHFLHWDINVPQGQK